jgi:hypothetical protein
MASIIKGFASSLLGFGLSVAAVLASLSVAQAQNTSFPQFSTVTAGPDQINLGNLDIHWSFPIFHKAGRNGHAYDVSLNYDSNSVYKRASATNPAVAPNPICKVIANWSLNQPESPIDSLGFAGTTCTPTHENPFTYSIVNDLGLSFLGTFGFGVGYNNLQGSLAAQTAGSELPGDPSAPYVSIQCGTAGPAYRFEHDWVFIDTAGVRHEFPGSYVIAYACSQVTVGGVSTIVSGPVQSIILQTPPQFAGDGSGYLLTITGFGTATVTTPSGSVLSLVTADYTGGVGNLQNYPFLPAAFTGFVPSAQYAIDANGNTSVAATDLSLGVNTQNATQGVNQDLQITDTLGMTPIRVSTQLSPSGQLQTFYTYIDPNGQAETVTVNYATYFAQSQLRCQSPIQVGVTPADQWQQYASEASLISSIVYPDGSAYRFTYEPTTTTSVDAPSNVPVTTGRLASVTLPTGGTVSYAYTGGYNCALWTPLGLTRATSDGDTTTYTRMLTGTGSGAQLGLAFWQTTVENALTKRIVNFAATSQGPSFDVHGVIAGSAENLYYQTSSTLIDKTQGSRTLSQDFTCYNGAAIPCDQTPITLPFVQRTQVTQLDTGQQKQVTTFLSPIGVPTEEDVYDYGQGAPGPLLKKTVTSYFNLANNIQDRPASVTVYDGAGRQTAQTLFNYDEFPLVATSGVPSHVAVAGAVRGNLTSTRHWVSTTGQYTIEHNTYDDTGNVVTSTDVNGNVTTFGFDDNFADGVNRNSRAYLAKTIKPSTTDNFTGGPVNHISSAIRDANTGLPTRVIDQNGNPTDYVYDGRLRLTKLQLPADVNGNRPETDMTYANPNTVTQTKPVTPPGVLQ